MKKNIFKILFLLGVILFQGNLSHAQPNKSPIKAIVFDLDGTIVDSEHFWFSMHLKVLEGHHIILDGDGEKELYNAMLGNPIVKTAAWIIERYSLKQTVEELIQSYHENSEKYYQGKITFVPGFESFFEKVNLYPLRFAIASNCDGFSTDLIDKSVNLEGRFKEHIYHKGYVVKGKPAPDIYLYAAKQINVEPHECLAIEDSATGIKSAQAAGMFCIGLNRGDRSKVAQADLIVDAYDQIDLETLLKGDTAQLHVAHS